MLDRSVPYIGVIMIKNNVKDYPRYDLPDGYRFVMYEPGFEMDWAQLETDVGEFKNTDEALEYFKKDFMTQADILPDRCVFVMSSSGDFCATASVWPGVHFGESGDRVHWVCVHPEHQGRGLAKAVMTRVMDRFNEISDNEMLYLTTQTSSYKAVNIYRKFGFRAYTGVKPVNWWCTDTWENDKIKAWKIINDKIDEYKTEKKK